MLVIWTVVSLAVGGVVTSMRWMGGKRISPGFEAFWWSAGIVGLLFLAAGY